VQVTGQLQHKTGNVVLYSKDKTQNV